MLKHTKGNLIDMAKEKEFDIIVHGCNCFNAMGGGIAREIAERLPYAQIQDSNTIKGDYNKLGNYTEVHDHVECIIINAYTQYTPSIADVDNFEYASFELILKKLAHTYPGLNYGFPYIGMGLAGGDATRIMPMLENFAKYIDSHGGSVTLVEFA
jgi:O-acetyl-ADP-ribose deacetylase (regulator of RNase III)